MGQLLNGKKGDNIHIYGRLTALADTFDALSSDRCYKKAWPLDKIMLFMEEERGRHFDSRCVDLFKISMRSWLCVDVFRIQGPCWHRNSRMPRK